MHRFIRIRIIRDLEQLEERLRYWREKLFPSGEVGFSYRPAADLYETPAGLVLRLELAGVAVEDLNIELAGQELLIRGLRRPLPPADITRVLHYEITYGRFERIFQIPLAIDPDGVQARYEQGILEVTLPRHRPPERRIPVRELLDTD